MVHNMVKIRFHKLPLYYDLFTLFIEIFYILYAHVIVSEINLLNYFILISFNQLLNVRRQNILYEFPTTNFSSFRSLNLSESVKYFRKYF